MIMELAPTLLGVYKTIKVKVRNQIAQIAVIGILHVTPFHSILGFP